MKLTLVLLLAVLAAVVYGQNEDMKGRMLQCLKEGVTCLQGAFDDCRSSADCPKKQVCYNGKCSPH